MTFTQKSVAEYAQSLLDHVVDSLTDPPERQIVYVGRPTDPLRGEQVAVGLARLFGGVPGAERADPTSICSAGLVADFTVRLLRCFPTSIGEQDSDPTAVGAAAFTLMGDAEALRLGLRSWEPKSTTIQSDVWVGPILGVRPQGFGHAIEVQVHVAV